MKSEWTYFFNLLNIEPTTDLNIVKKAYAAKLKSINPQDNMELFQEIKALYKKFAQSLKSEHSDASEKVGIEKLFNDVEVEKVEPELSTLELDFSSDMRSLNTNEHGVAGHGHSNFSVDFGTDFLNEISQANQDDAEEVWSQRIEYGNLLDGMDEDLSNQIKQILEGIAKIYSRSTLRFDRKAWLDFERKINNLEIDDENKPTIRYCLRQFLSSYPFLDDTGLRALFNICWVDNGENLEKFKRFLFEDQTTTFERQFFIDAYWLGEHKDYAVSDVIKQLYKLDLRDPHHIDFFMFIDCYLCWQLRAYKTDTETNLIDSLFLDFVLSKKENFEILPYYATMIAVCLVINKKEERLNKFIDALDFAQEEPYLITFGILKALVKDIHQIKHYTDLLDYYELNYKPLVVFSQVYRIEVSCATVRHALFEGVNHFMYLALKEFFEESK